MDRETALALLAPLTEYDRLQMNRGRFTFSTLTLVIERAKQNPDFDYQIPTENSGLMADCLNEVFEASRVIEATK